MRRAERPLAHFAEHLREFKQAGFTIERFHPSEGATLIHQFLDLIMLVAKDGELR